ncbi:MAG: hypothetical protein PVI84_12385 [Syntrophobacterales bacterium]
MRIPFFSHHSCRPCLYLLLFCLVFPFLVGLRPIARFTEEQIDIHVYQDHVRVNGYYIYENPFPFPVVQGFLLPLPVGESHPQPILISAKKLYPTEKPIPIRSVLGRYVLNLTLAAGERSKILIQYYQHAPEKNARYILTTTESWRRPLVRGLYRLLPQGVKITSSNYSLDSGEPGLLRFQRQEFMPLHDWLFSWEVGVK